MAVFSLTSHGHMGDRQACVISYLLRTGFYFDQDLRPRVPGHPRDFSKSVFEVITYSALNFAFLSPLILTILTNQFYDRHRFWFFAATVVVLVIAPALWPLAYLKLLSWGPLARRAVHPIAEPWDYVFQKRERLWIIVHLKDGRMVGGRFDSDSFASSIPADHELYLQEVWQLDERGGFIKRVDRSRGIIIIEKDIVAIEFFD